MEHPIEGLMTTAMNSIQDMVDVNTIIGEPIETSNNTVVIPISKVSFGFAAGGSEFKGGTVDEYSRKDKQEDIQYKLPFGGGSGAGVSINPVAFMVIQKDGVKLLPVNHASSIDKLLDYIPDVIEKATEFTKKLCKDENKNITVVTEKPKVRKTTVVTETEKNEQPIKKTRKTILKDSPNTTIEYEYDENENDNIDDYTNYDDYDE